MLTTVVLSAAPDDEEQTPVEDLDTRTTPIIPDVG